MDKEESRYDYGKEHVRTEKFTLGGYNGGQGRIANAQYLSEQAGRDPQIWNDVENFLEVARATKAKADEIRNYIESILAYEIEFAKKSPANKNAKKKKGRKTGYHCTQGQKTPDEIFGNIT